MKRSQRLREQDTRALYRLLSDLREMRHDRPAMHRHLVETLLQMVGGSGAFLIEAKDWRPDGTPQLLAMVPTQAGVESIAEALRMLASRNNLWDDPTFERGVHLQGQVEAIPFHQLISDIDLGKAFPVMAETKAQVGHVDHLTAWHQAGPAPGQIVGVSVHRYGAGEKLFNGRETAVVRLFFEELHWLHTTGRLAPAVPEVADLPERLKQILDRLLLGRAPKEIAHELGLSLHTVGEHICRLYDRVGVSGRDELMAKFVRQRVA